MVWIFAYNSTSWKPDFKFQQKTVGFVHGFKRRYSWKDEVHRGCQGYDGRVVNIYKVPTNTSHEDLLEYKNLETLESSEIDKECCWGIAYKVNIYSWEHDGIRVKVEDNNPDGFVPTKMTFYPVGVGFDPIDDVIVYNGDVDGANNIDGETIDEIVEKITSSTGPSGTNVSYAICLAQGLRNLDIGENKATHVFEIERLVKKKQQIIEQEKMLTRAMNYYFNMVDTDRNGVITFPEFTKLALEYFSTSESDTANLVDRFQLITTDSDGLIDREEFVEFFLKHHRENSSSGGMVSLHRMISREGTHGTEQIDLIDRILFGIQQMDIEEMEAEKSSGLSGLEEYLSKNNVFYEQLKKCANPEAKKILEYMFPHSMADSMNLWFGKSPETDDYITKTFEKMVCEARDGKYDDWISNPIDCLALIILLDQFPRNIYRHKAVMYASDYKAQGVCSQILYLGHHRYLTPLQCVFMPCLVFTHAENIHLQRLCVTIWNHYVQNKLKPGDPLFIFETIFLYHLQVVEQFGHFPHRNKILCRTDTPEETEFLKNPAFRFDLPLVYGEDGSCTFVKTDDFNERRNVMARKLTVKKKKKKRDKEEEP